MAASILPAPVAPGYLQITLADALGTLAERLQDPNNVYWSHAELKLYLVEALRTWQAYTSWYRQTAQLTVNGGSEVWYDLAAKLPVAQFGYRVSDRDLASAILYHLLEPQLVGNAWAGTDQFDLAQLQAALQNRIHRWLSDSGAVLARVVQDSGIVPPASRALLTPTIIDVRRMAWAAGTTTTLLWRENEWAMNSFLWRWPAVSGTPRVYSLSVTPPVMVQLAPPPDAGGALDMVVVENGPILNLSSGATLVGIPDDFTWGIKFGALADLLSQDGQAKDLARAAYCEQRYRECVELAKSFPSVVQAWIDGLPVWCGSVSEMDAFANDWESNGKSAVGLAGRNLMAVSPPPGTHVVSFDLAANMPVPTADTDYLWVPKDVYHVILDYAQHLASFKMGGDEFFATEQQRTNFIQLAAAYNGRLRQLDTFNEAVRAASSKQLSQVTRLDVPDTTAPGYAAGVRTGGGSQSA